MLASLFAACSAQVIWTGDFATDDGRGLGTDRSKPPLMKAGIHVI